MSVVGENLKDNLGMDAVKSCRTLLLFRHSNCLDLRWRKYKKVFIVSLKCFSQTLYKVAEVFGKEDALNILLLCIYGV